MRVLITLAGGSSSIEGDLPGGPMIETMELLKDRTVDFVLLEKTPYGDVVVNKSAISYIRRKQ